MLCPVVRRASKTLLLLLLVGGLLPRAARAEDALAEAVVVEGKVNVRRGKILRPLKVGEHLTAADTLVTAFEAFAILRLENDHLVRIDEDLQLPVGKIVLLKAPKTEASAEAQLAVLLYPEEKEALAGEVKRVERTAGWHSRIMAFDTAPADSSRSGTSKKAKAPAPPPPASPARPAKTAPGGASSDPAARTQSLSLDRKSSLDDDAREKEREEVRKSEAALSDELAGNTLERAASAEPIPVPGSASAPQAEPAPPNPEEAKAKSVSPVESTEGRGGLRLRETHSAPMKVPPPLGRRALLRDRALRICLFTHLPPGVRAMPLFLKIEDGQIRRLRLNGARPVPACARSLLLGRAWKGKAPRGWLALKLTRP